MSLERRRGLSLKYSLSSRVSRAAKLPLNQQSS